MTDRVSKIRVCYLGSIDCICKSMLVTPHEVINASQRRMGMFLRNMAIYMTHVAMGKPKLKELVLATGISKSALSRGMIDFCKKVKTRESAWDIFNSVLESIPFAEYKHAVESSFAAADQDPEYPRDR